MIQINNTHKPKKTIWEDLKSKIADNHPLQYISKSLSSGIYYQVYIKLNNNYYFMNIYNPNHWRHDQSVYDDFMTNFKPVIDAKPRTDTGLIDGSKIPVHQTSRVPGTTTNFSCASDDQSHPSMVGGNVPESQKLKGVHKIGDPMTMVKYQDLNTIDNYTGIHEGYLQWLGALNDEITVSFVPKVSTVSPGTNTNYALYQGYMIIPAAGDGDINVDEMVLVEMPENEFGNRGLAFWNANYNSTTHVFENITPAFYGDGKFNMFTVEFDMIRFANKVPLLGSGFMNLQTSDTSALGHNIRIKVQADTIGDDHEWWWNVFPTLHRIKTT